MAFPTAVNSQITDAVTQTNVEVLGDAPAQALGTLYQTMAHSLSLAAQNAVSAQQAMNELSMATTTACVSALLGTGSH
ncbi:RebB family R body protein [Novosphingobium beihaiensis]|uniref:RebB family R body protein n=1 Tax=Novosphingobium beihaiensis TaxID=2930389 RepID=A0ABT0BK75_9SPHN|nr:RebB family R body protein [Novosphingobium beihaiensis]MCJ2185355.1 RebB family R body protein [Novosphingobium beihaiensis]